MDTISRENNSMLPMGALIAGVLGLLLGGYAAFVAAPKASKTLAQHEEKLAKMDEITTQATAAATDAAKREVQAVRKETNDAFATVGNYLSELQKSVTKLEDAQKKPAAATHTAGGTKTSEPPVAGPDEYVIKPGDTFSKIAAAQGLKPADIAAVNPGVDSSKLHVGQKIKLPKK